jgi:hypothetical protein
LNPQSCLPSACGSRQQSKPSRPLASLFYHFRRCDQEATRKQIVYSAIHIRVFYGELSHSPEGIACNILYIARNSLQPPDPRSPWSLRKAASSACRYQGGPAAKQAAYAEPLTSADAHDHHPSARQLPCVTPLPSPLPTAGRKADRQPAGASRGACDPAMRESRGCAAFQAQAEPLASTSSPALPARSPRASASEGRDSTAFSPYGDGVISRKGFCFVPRF